MRVLGGRYQLLGPIGAGGMSEVWEGHDEVLDRPVAVKLLNPHEAADPRAIARVRDEARCAARLAHPNAAGVYDFGVAPGQPPTPYIVMELVDGYTVARRLSEGPLDWRTAVRVCAEVGAALSTAHANRIVHGDVKPGNVMLAPSGAKVLDFGAAGVIGRTGTGVVQGTPQYLAPELLDGRPSGPAADTYALGLLLFICLTGQFPSTGRYAHAALEHVDDLDPVLADLCVECLDPDPTRRPTTLGVTLILADAVSARLCLPSLDAALMHRPATPPTGAAPLGAPTQRRPVDPPRPAPRTLQPTGSPGRHRA